MAHSLLPQQYQNIMDYVCSGFKARIAVISPIRV